MNKYKFVIFHLIHSMDRSMLKRYERIKWIQIVISYLKKGKQITWRQTQFDGAWIKGQTAGGCGQPKIG